MENQIIDYAHVNKNVLYNPGGSERHHSSTFPLRMYLWQLHVFTISIQEAKLRPTLKGTTTKEQL